MDFDSFLDSAIDTSKSKSKSKYSVEDVQNMVYGQESTYGKAKTDKPNYAGAIGPMQIIPSTFEGLKKKSLIPKDYDINNPEHNKAAGNALIADDYKKYNGDADKVLASYYAGNKAVEGDTIHREWGDKKNKNAPLVGQYIDQSKNRFEANQDPFLKFLENATGKNAPEQLQDQFSEKKKGGFVSNAAGLADTIAGGPAAVAGMATYAGARALQKTPEEATALSEKVADTIDKPFGKALGVTEDAAYKNEASQRLMSFVGENVSKGADWISQKTGLPKADVENMINIGLIAVAPEASKTIGKEAGMIKSSLQDQFAKKKAEFAPKEKVVEPAPAIETPVKQTYKPGENFTETSYAEKSVAPEEATSRKALLERTVGSDLEAVSPNVIEGKGRARANDYALSLTDTPPGHEMAEQFAKEKEAQNKYGEQLIKETGGTKGLDESASYKRGGTIIKPLEELSTHLDNGIKELYKKRDQQAAGIPVVAEDVNAVLNQKSNYLASTDKKTLAEGARVRMEELGITDEKGNLLPANALQAEKFRQYLNEEWKPGNATLNAKLKDAIDNDVFKNAGKDIHKDARALYKYRKDTLDNTKGIAALLDTSGPNGINRKVDFEKIGNTISNMHVDQLTHIIKTLNSVPEELKPAAQAAISEIKAQFMNQAHEAFNKSANAGTKYLNENKEVFNRIFTPEEMAKINDYNSLAHVLKTDTGYKGSAVQSLNLEKSFKRKATEFVAKKVAFGAAEFVTGGALMGLSDLAAHHYLNQFFEKRDVKHLNQLAKENKASRTKLSSMTGK
jgi:hypothetical protein